MKAKSLWHLSINAIGELYDKGIYEQKGESKW